MKSNMETLPPKVEAVFQAVISLLNQGYTADSIKVSMIAKEAGIGKGTVYEYFDSKEEVVADAVIYEVQMTLQEITRKLAEEKEFDQMLLKILEWIEENYKNKTSFVRLLKMSEQTADVPGNVRAELEKQGHSHCEFHEYMNSLVQYGYEVGSVSQAIPQAMASAAITSGIMMYLLYLENSKGQEAMSSEEARRFVVESILKTCGNS